MRLRFNWINQWPAVVALGDGFNWVDFTIIHLDVEWKRYAGRYYEATVIVLGLGFGIDYYEPMELEPLGRVRPEAGGEEGPDE